MRMINLQSSLLKRYFDKLDRFLTLRVFSTKEIAKLFQSANITNKREYISLVLNACVVDFNKIFEDVSIRDNPTEIFNSLYELCISVNPFLDITKVSLPISEETPSELHLLEGKHENADVSHRLYSIKNELEKEIIGQESAIKGIEKTLKKSFLGLRNLKKPVSVFLFVGRTGVGKTELAKALSKVLYSSFSRLLRINCSEYMLSHEYAKLLGAPPGYIGYDESGLLSSHLLNNPEIIVLFDEIEKANENIHNLLLQVMDDGYVQDSKGRILDFTKAIIILTSNLGISEIDALQKRIGFVKEDLNSQTITDITKESLKNKFRPEFINRINDIIVFKNLTITDCSKIVGKFLNEIIVYTSRIPIEFRYTSDIPDYLAQMGYSAEYGARELRRTVDEFVLNPLSDRIIERGLKPGDKVTAKIIRGKIRFHKN